MEKSGQTSVTTPLISVVIPVYNAKQDLGEALESLRSQSYARFEAVLVDDGSTDGSAEICRRYCETDSRFRMLAQPNYGVSAARNHGIENARGEWIAFLDADDLLLPNSLRPMLDVAIGTGAPVVAASYFRGTPDTVKLPVTDVCATDVVAKASVMPAAEAICLGLYQKRILNNPWGMLFSADLFRLDPSLRFRPGRYEDLDIFYRIFEKAGRVALIDLPVYLYRDNPASFINTWSISRLDALDVTDRMVAHYRGRYESHPTEANGKLLKAARDRRFSAHYNILLLMLREGIDPPGQRTRCLRVIRRQRLHELTDSNVRFKNKIGALLSYGGLPALSLISRFNS